MGATPKEKEDFDRVMRLMFDAASILRYDLDGTVVLMSGSAASVVVASAYVLSSLFLGYVAVVCRQQVATIVPLSRIVGSQGCRFEAWSSASGGFHPSKVPRTRTGNRLSSGYCRESFRPTLCAIHRNHRLESGIG